MKHARVLSVALFLGMMVGAIDTGYGYTTGAVWNWDSSVPNYNASATIHAGTINTGNLAFGDFLGRSSTQPNAGFFGSSGAAVGWDDTWTGGIGHANTNGDFLDGLWSQIYSDGGWWDLGAQYSRIAAFSSQDHGPYLGEGLEYRIYGTNTLWTGALSAQATLTDVYLDGWRVHNSAEDANGNLWLSDDVSAEFVLDSSYRYIKLVAWGVGPSGQDYTEPEIDAIAGRPVIPEPSSMLILGVLLVGLGVVRRRS